MNLLKLQHGQSQQTPSPSSRTLNRKWGDTGCQEALAVASPAPGTFLRLVWRTVSHFLLQQVLPLTTTTLLPQVLPGSSQDVWANETYTLVMHKTASLTPA